MSTIKQLQDNIIFVCGDPTAHYMAGVLDRALNALVENEQHKHTESFGADYFSLERLRTAVRQLAESSTVVSVHQDAASNPFSIDTSGPLPIWSFPYQMIDEDNNSYHVVKRFSPQPLVEIIQKLSVEIIVEELTIAQTLLRAIRQEKDNVDYEDAANWIKLVCEAIRRGDVPDK
jgi:hypothetical protein